MGPTEDEEGEGEEEEEEEEELVPTEVGQGRQVLAERGNLGSPPPPKSRKTACRLGPTAPSSPQSQDSFQTPPGSASLGVAVQLAAANIDRAQPVRA